MSLSPDQEQSATTAVRGGVVVDPVHGAVVPGICQSTTYAQPAIGVHAGYTYSRAHNPTVTALENALAGLEDLPWALATGTGMSAISTLVAGVLDAGDHVVCSDVVYGGTVRLFERVLQRFGVAASFVDTADLNAVRSAFTPETKLVLIESPANPTLKLTDIAAVSEIAHEHGALVAVDNTFLTAVLQRPADLGADVVLYSTTKFIEGHDTAVGGAIVLADEALHARLDEVRKTLGTIQAPHDAWLTLKGLKTLPLRLARHSENALSVARWLELHPAVRSVAHPWLDSFPQAELARRQQADGGGVIAFEVEGGADAAVAVMNALRFCIRAENLGATETLVTHPVSMTHGDVPREHRERVGITDGLVRLSVGIEDPSDIIEDLDRALASVVAGVWS